MKWTRTTTSTKCLQLHVILYAGTIRRCPISISPGKLFEHLGSKIVRLKNLRVLTSTPSLFLLFHAERSQLILVQCRLPCPLPNTGGPSSRAPSSESVSSSMASSETKKRGRCRLSSTMFDHKVDVRPAARTTATSTRRRIASGSLAAIAGDMLLTFTTCDDR